MVAAFLTGTGLASSSGLNAYLPLLILALVDRSSNIIDLNGGWAAISSTWAIIGLMIILPLELVGDKIPRFDHLNDLAHSAIRPLAGAVCMAAVAGQAGGYKPALGFALGLVFAAAVHLFKMRARPSITRATAGIGNPIQSTIEDTAVVAVSLAAVFLPWSIIPVVPLAGALIWRSSRSLQSSSGRVRFLYRGRS